MNKVKASSSFLSLPTLLSSSLLSVSSQQQILIQSPKTNEAQTQPPPLLSSLPHRFSNSRDYSSSVCLTHVVEGSSPPPSRGNEVSFSTMHGLGFPLPTSCLLILFNKRVERLDQSSSSDNLARGDLFVSVVGDCERVFLFICFVILFSTNTQYFIC